MSLMRLRGLLLLACIVGILCTNTFADETADGNALVERALKTLILRVPGKPAFGLGAKFRIVDDLAQDFDSNEGTYLELWNSPEQWRRDVVVGKFHQIETYTAKRSWLAPGLTDEFFSLKNVTRLLSMGGFDFVNGKVKEVKEETAAGIKERCVEIETDRHTDERFCFDESSGAVVSVVLSDNIPTKAIDSFEFSDYAGFGDQSYPRKLRLFRKGKLSIEADVLTLKTENPTADLFVPPAGAQEEQTCLNINQPQVISNPDPKFPTRENGHVEIRLVVGADGIPYNLKIRKSAGKGKAFDDAALEAVRQWKFKPATCGTTPVPRLIIVEINNKLY